MDGNVRLSPSANPHFQVHIERSVSELLEKGDTPLRPFHSCSFSRKEISHGTRAGLGTGLRRVPLYGLRTDPIQPRPTKASLSRGRATPFPVLSNISSVGKWYVQIVPLILSK